MGGDEESTVRNGGGGRASHDNNTKDPPATLRELIDFLEAKDLGDYFVVGEVEYRLWTGRGLIGFMCCGCCSDGWW